MRTAQQAIKYASVAFVFVVAVVLAAVFLRRGPDGGAPLERWLGSQVASVVSYWLVPDLQIGSVRYTPPATLSLRDVRLVATAGAEVRTDIIVADELVLTLASAPRLGEPIVLDALAIAGGEVRLVAEAPGSRRLVGFSNFVERPDDEPPEEFQLSRFLKVRRITLSDVDLTYDPKIEDTRPMRLDRIDLEADILASDDGWYSITAEVDRKPLIDVRAVARMSFDTLDLAVSELDVAADVDEEGVATLPPQLQRVINSFGIIGHLAITGSTRLALKGGARGSFDLRALMSEGHARVAESDWDIRGLALRLSGSDWPDSPTTLTARLSRGQLARPWRKHEVSDVVADVEMAPDVIRLRRVAANAAKGRIDLEATIDTGVDAKMDLDAEFENVELAEFIELWRLADEGEVHDDPALEGAATGKVSFVSRPGGDDSLPAPGDAVSNGGGENELALLAGLDGLPPAAVMIDAEISDVRVRWPEGTLEAGYATLDSSSDTWPGSPLATQLTLEDGVLSTAGYDVLFEELESSVAVSRDALRMDSVQARLFGGELEFAGRIPRRTDQRMVLNARVADVRLEEMMKSRPDAESTPSSLSGSLSGEAEYEAAIDEWTTAASGRGWLEVRDGSLLELPVVSQLTAAMQGATKLVIPRVRDRPLKDSAEVGFRLVGDHLHCGRIRIDTPLLAARGDGEVYFDGRLDLELGAGPTKKVEPLLGPVGKVVGKIADQLTYYKVRGSLGKPKVKLRTLKSITGK